MKSLFQLTSKRLPKESHNNPDKMLIKSIKGSSSTMSMGHKVPLVFKDARSKSILRSTVLNPMSRLSTNTSRFEKREILLDEMALFGLTKIDQGTQTEEVFFNMHWTYFAGKYPIRQSKSINISGEKIYGNHNNRNRGLSYNNYSFSNTGRYPMIQSNYQSNQFRKQLLQGFQLNKYNY